VLSLGVLGRLTTDGSPQTFNEELEQAYDDAQLTHPDFANAMMAQLKQNKAGRYAALVENECVLIGDAQVVSDQVTRRLKKELQVAQLRAREYEGMLRANGLMA
jgi:hypothetical protein